MLIDVRIGCPAHWQALPASPPHPPLGSAQPSVAAYLAGWLAHVRSRVRASTFSGYESLVRCHAVPALGERRLAELRPLDLQALYGQLLAGASGRALAGGTVLNLHLVLTQAFAQAVRWQILDRNPAAGAQPPRPRRAQAVIVNADLAARILAATHNSALELPVAIALATGMRRGEVLGLRWADVDLHANVARVRATLQPSLEGLVFEEPKTRRSRRTVDLPRFLGPYLERQHTRQKGLRDQLGSRWVEHGLVVDRGDGGPVNPDSFSSAWRRFLRIRKLPPVRFHDLRHAHATLMLLQGVHPKVVSERLGHASIGITLDTYSHVLPSMQSEAAAAFDRLFPPWEDDPTSS